MKLLQLNVWQGRTIRRALPFLTKQNPDILCIQEVYSSKTEPHSWDAFHSLELIQNELGIPHVFFSPLYSFYVAGEKVTFGNAILSRFPFKNAKSIFTKGKYIDDISKDELLSNTRNVQSVILEIDNFQLKIVNHHAHREPTGAGSEESVLRMRKVVDFIGTTGLPIIIAGDMNVNPSTETAKLLQRYGTNLTGTSLTKSTMTDLAMFLPVAPDHIITSKEIDVKDFTISEETVSDHKALILEFDL